MQFHPPPSRMHPPPSRTQPQVYSKPTYHPPLHYTPNKSIPFNTNPRTSSLSHFNHFNQNSRVLIPPPQKSLSHFNHFNQNSRIFIPPNMPQKLTLLDNTLQPIDINLNIIVNKDGKLHNNATSQVIEKPMDSQPNQPSRVYDTTIQTPQIYCVICDKSYNDGERDTHVELHRKDYNHDYKPIKTFSRDKSQSILQPITKPIVEPEQYNVQYTPQNITLQLNKNYKPNQSQHLPIIYSRPTSTPFKQSDINSRQSAINSRQPAISSRQPAINPNQSVRNTLPQDLKVANPLPTIMEKTIEVTLFNNIEMDRQSIDVQDKPYTKRKIKQNEINPQPNTQSQRLPRESTYQQNANLYHTTITPNRQTLNNNQPNLNTHTLNNPRSSNTNNLPVQQSRISNSSHLSNQQHNLAQRQTQPKLNQINFNQIIGEKNNNISRNTQVAKDNLSVSNGNSQLSRDNKSIRNERNSQISKDNASIKMDRVSQVPQNNQQLKNQTNLEIPRENNSIKIQPNDPYSNDFSNSRFSNVQEFKKVTPDSNINSVIRNTAQVNFKKKKISKHTLQLWKE